MLCNVALVSVVQQCILAESIHEIKRRLLQAMTNLDSILKSRDITLPTEVRLVKAMVFPVVIYGCESWTVKKAEHRRIDAFELCWRRLLRVPLTARTSNHLILCRPLLLLPSIFPRIRVFSNEPNLCIRWPKYWSFSFSISPSNEHTGLISFRMDWLDIPAVQGTLKSLLQHHSSKASILRCSAFFTVQLSHPYMTTGKTLALTRWTFVVKVMSQLFNVI